MEQLLTWYQRFISHYRVLNKGLAVILFTLLSWFSISADTSTEEGYPWYTETYVNDFDDLFTLSQESELRSLLMDFRDKTGIEAVVVTIPAYRSYNTGDSSYEGFATSLFNYWGIGDSVKNDGVLILLSATDRTVRIELGYGWSREYDEKMQKIIDDHMLPSYREYQYYEGTLRGTKKLIRILSGGLIIPRGAYVILALVLILFGRLFYRFRPHRCKKCQGEMSLLEEDADDEFLKEEEKLEERLKSRDYDVWKCASCGSTQKYRFNNIFSRYRPCRSCSVKAMRVTSRTIVAATYSSSGKGIRTFLCKSCDYHHKEYYTIPQKTRSSSGGSSGSFGGGSSRGGGASGSW